MTEWLKQSQWLQRTALILAVIGGLSLLGYLLGWLGSDQLAVWFFIFSLLLFFAKDPTQLRVAGESSQTSPIGWKSIFRVVFGFGVPLLAIPLLSSYLSGNTPFFLHNISPLQFLVSVTLAGLFPISAISYLLFQHESKLKMLTEDFWKLGIDIRGAKLENNQTVSKAPKDLAPDDYRQYIEQVGAERHVSMNYVALPIPALLVTVVGLSLFPWSNTNGWSLQTIIPNDENILQALRFGFLGAYVYALQLVYRRYTTLDLQPSVYINCALTIIAGVAFNFVAFKAITDVSANSLTPTAEQRSNGSANTNSLTDLGSFAGINTITTTNIITTINTLTGTTTITNTSAVTATGATGSVPASTQAPHAASGIEGGILAIIAFSLGYFPSLAIRWFNRIAHTALGMTQRRADHLSLGLIDGISQLHETRLLDEGIDNLQNLAAAKLDELLMNSRFSAQQVVDWVDQAALYLYLEPTEIESFRRAGVRGLTDLQDSWKPFCIDLCTKPEEKSDKEKLDFEQQRKARSLLLQSVPERLDQLYCATQRGPNVVHIKNYWERAKETQINE